MPRLKSPPPVNLDRSKHRYMSYEDGARLMGIPYWGFVRMAKEADATWALRKTAMVDMNVVEKYIEENCINLSWLMLMRITIQLHYGQFLGLELCE